MRCKTACDSYFLFFQSVCGHLVTPHTAPLESNYEGVVGGIEVKFSVNGPLGNYVVIRLLCTLVNE